MRCRLKVCGVMNDRGLHLLLIKGKIEVFFFQFYDRYPPQRTEAAQQNVQFKSVSFNMPFITIRRSISQISKPNQQKPGFRRSRIRWSSITQCHLISLLSNPDTRRNLAICNHGPTFSLAPRKPEL